VQGEADRAGHNGTRSDEYRRTSGPSDRHQITRPGQLVIVDEQ
jgi:hypothetical protein